MSEIVPFTARGAVPAPHTDFDYGGIPADLAEEARDVAATIRARVRKVEETAIAARLDVGRSLLAMKAKLEHGLFGKWVQAECGFTTRTAENLMNVALFLSGKSESVSHLPGAIISALAAPSAAPAIVEEAIAAAEAGAPPPLREIKEKLAAAAADERRARVEAAKSPDKIKKEKQARLSRQQRAARRDAERREEREREEREKQELDARLRPLTARIVACLSAADVQELASTFSNWRSSQMLPRLLREELAADDTEASATRGAAQ